MTTIRDLLREKAIELAASAEVTAVQVLAAAEYFIAEILRERAHHIAVLRASDAPKVGDTVKVGAAIGTVSGFDASGVVVERKGADGKPLQSSSPAHLVQPAPPRVAPVQEDAAIAPAASGAPASAPQNGDEA